jgi:hypothetical protein
MGDKAPDPPDPYKVAAADAEGKIKTAREQQKIAMTGQVNPFGSKQYVIDPSSPSGYREITEFSPEMQALLSQGQDLQALSGGIIGNKLGVVGDRGEFSMDAGRGKVLSDIERTMMDPLWESRREQFDNQMRNEGLMPGSEAYENRMRQFEQQSADAYNKMFLGSYGMGNDAAMKEWMMPLQEAGAIASIHAGQPLPGMPQFGATPSPGVAPTDLAGIVNNTYQQQVAAANAATTGLYGLGAAGLGGWASKGFPGASALLAALPSDRRLKTEIELIGQDPRGWGIYRFKYVWGPKEFIGFMADEVEPIRPDAVVTHPNGYKAINYDLLGSQMTEVPHG